MREGLAGSDSRIFQERLILAALALTPDRMGEFPSEAVRAEHFTDAACRDVWSAIVTRHTRGEPWDVALIYSDTSAAGQEWLRRVEPRDMPIPALIPQYAKALRESAWFRMAAEELRALASDGPVDPAVFAARLESRIAREEPTSTQRTAREMLKDYYGHLEAVKAQGGLSGVETGLASLDSFFGGFQASRMYVLAARPSMGKSALLLHFALAAATRDVPTYLQSLEESRLALAGRMLSRHLKLDNETLQRGQFEASRWADITAGVGSLGALPLIVDDAASLTADQICQRVRIAHRRFPLGFIGIDHIQETRQTQTSRHLDISAAAGAFKSLAKDLKVPVMVVSQLSRAVEQARECRPSMAHLKESGDIEAKADVVMLLYRPHYYRQDADPRLAELHVAKNRDGRVGKFSLDWNAATMTFGPWRETMADKWGQQDAIV